MTTLDGFTRARRGAGVALGTLAIVALAGRPAAAQSTEDGRWLPWLGCWELAGVDADEGAERPGALCVVPEAGGVELLTVVDGQVAARRALVADGQRRSVEDSGCTGWEQASWSADGQRVYLRSELTCEGGTRRATSAAMTMVTPNEWLDIQTIEAGGYPMLRARRFQAAGKEVAATAGVRVAEGRALAIENARTAAAEPLSVADVSEAARELSLETLELMLFERGGIFEVNANTLMQMADAGVPERVIDLVVALAYPNVFAVNTEARVVGYAPDEPRPVGEDVQRRPRYVGFDPFYSPYGYGYGRYGYSPYGFGDPYGWRYTGGPVIIIQPPPTGDGEVAGRGRAVKGRGYTRGSRSADDRSPIPQSSAGARSGGSAGTATGASSATSRGSGGTDTGRTARRRGDGGN